ncbi:MAG: carbohydrate ABC transporter permease [bacterium]
MDTAIGKPLFRFPRGLRQSTRRALTGYLFISPWIVGLLTFTLIPILAVFVLSFTRYGVFDTPKWVGLTNYKKILTGDRLFPISLINTLYYVSLTVPLRVVIGFLLALGLNAKIRGVTLYRTFFYVPSIVPQVAAVTLFIWLFQPQIGLLNFLLSLVGVKGPNWLGRPEWAKPAIVIMSMWSVGGTMIVYLAGLQSIPHHLYEAAEIDGANWWHKFWSVTVPMMTPTIFFNLIMGLIGSFQVFTTAYVATGGGPVNSTLFYLLYLYRSGFQDFRMGYASALAWILFLLVLLLTLLLFRSSQSWVYYEAGGER